MYGLKEKDKVFKFDVTLGFEVSAKDKEKAKALIEEELEFINPAIVTDEIWFDVSELEGKDE